ncbi:hypothetical protein [Streptomyces sp. Inha503]|uniref:hypothetical protein n=1 Tax=Streptomyces sp. Inha503 TaxID=3383314 RepID=UPI0039A05913
MTLSSAFIVVTSLLLVFAHGAALGLYLASAACGIGVGLGTTQWMNIVVAVVPPERVSSVSGTVFVLRSVGATLGGQIGASVLASGMGMDPKALVPTWSAYATTFVIGAAISVVALALSVALPARLPAAAGA